MGLPYAKHKARSWAPSGGGQGVHAVLLSLRATSTTQELNWGVYKTAFKVPSSIYTNMTFLEFCSNRPGQEASEHGANSPEKNPSAESSEALLLSYSRGSVGKGRQGV